MLTSSTYSIHVSVADKHVYIVYQFTKTNNWSALNMRGKGFGYGFQRDFQQYFSYIVVISCIGRVNRRPRENHRPVVSH
jgi:hypothetical protein